MATKSSKAYANTKTEPAKAPASAPSARPPSRDTIASRAYEIWRQSGGAHGHDQADWFQAERELRTRTTAR